MLPDTSCMGFEEICTKMDRYERLTFLNTDQLFYEPILLPSMLTNDTIRLLDVICTPKLQPKRQAGKPQNDYTQVNNRLSQLEKFLCPGTKSERNSSMYIL